jgi:zinc protease
MRADMGQLIGLAYGSSWQGPFDFTLANGIRVLFGQRESSPIVELRLVLEGGFAADPDRRSGLTSLATAMFSQGLVRVDGAELGSLLESLGALPCGQVMPDAAVMGMSALAANFIDALRLYANAFNHPEFRTEDLELLRANRLALIASERLNPFELARRVLPPMVYGRGHIYARPFTGSGTDRDLTAITSDDLNQYYVSHFVPPSSTLVVAGAGKATELRQQLEEAFGQWRSESAAAPPIHAAEMREDGPSVVIVNRPGASQTTLSVGLRTVAPNSSYAEALMVADTISAGIFTSRLNLSLRERKGWTYGVRSSLLDARREGLWVIQTAVRTNCTAQAMAEIAGEINNMAGAGLARDEFARAVDCLVARMPSQYETCAQMADALGRAAVYGLPILYPQELAARLLRLKPDDVTETCRRLLALGGLRWVLVGEAAQLVHQLGENGFDNIKVVESNSAEVP